jgi:cobalt-zinc-cadmium efflux system membrane fusion protein
MLRSHLRIDNLLVDRFPTCNPIYVFEKSFYIMMKNYPNWLSVRMIVLSLVSLAIGSFATRMFITSTSDPAVVANPDSPSHPEPATTNIGQVSLPQELWKGAKIEVKPALRSDLSHSVRLTGKVGLNEDRVAHIYPMVEGAVESVHVQLGQQVLANDLLVIIHSREVGQAKLELYQARLLLDFAKMKEERTKEVVTNTLDLIAELRQNVPIDAIEEKFRNRPMGENRQKLLSAYTNLYKSQVDFSRLESLGDRSAIPAKQFVSAEALRNADRANFQANLEQIEYDIKNMEFVSSQTVSESVTRVAVAETKLSILGYKREELSNVNPALEDEAISHYPIRAPFDGTVLSKDVALLEFTRPGVQLISIADLSTVWIAADVYEENLPILQALTDKEILVRNEAWPDRTFSAQIFYTGEVMDESSRTIALRATASNSERLLKPGMFVNVELPGAIDKDVLQVPAAAIQEHEGQKFVFVQKTDDLFQRVNVKVGRVGNDGTEVLEGLDENAPVVVSGGFILKSKLLADLMGGE